MTKKQIQQELKKVINETQKRPKLCEKLKDKKISQLGELLLFTQVLIRKIKSGRHNVLDEVVYRKTINFYCG